jgi:hypothetical protein
MESPFSISYRRIFRVCAKPFPERCEYEFAVWQDAWMLGSASPMRNFYRQAVKMTEYRFAWIHLNFDIY